MARLVHPFSMLIAGPSCCGKSTFVTRIIENIDWLIDKPISKIIWCHAEANAIPKALANIKNIEFYKGIPENFNNLNHEPILVILDDLMLDAYNSRICELFTKGSHHRNISVILITQNIFHQGKHCRDISLNAKYIVVFKNPRDKLQFQHLARQIYPEDSRQLMKIYKEITERAHGYLFIDLTQDVHDSLRFRSSIFTKDYCTVYCSPATSLAQRDDVESETFDGQQAYAICSTKGKC